MNIAHTLSDGWSTILDPGHTIAEVFWDLVTFFVLQIFWKRGIRGFVRRALHNEHQTIDREHGFIDHHPLPSNVFPIRPNSARVVQTGGPDIAG